MKKKAIYHDLCAVYVKNGKYKQHDQRSIRELEYKRQKIESVEYSNYFGLILLNQLNIEHNLSPTVEKFVKIRFYALIALITILQKSEGRSITS